MLLLLHLWASVYLFASFIIMKVEGFSLPYFYSLPVCRHKSSGEVCNFIADGTGPSTTINKSRFVKEEGT